MPLGFLAFAISTVWRAVELLDRRDSGTMDAGTGDGCGVGAMCASDRWPSARRQHVTSSFTPVRSSSQHDGGFLFPFSPFLR